VGGSADIDQVLPADDEALAIGVAEYQRRADSGLSADVIRRQSLIAARQLRKLILYPSPAQASHATVSHRSKDFGTDIAFPVLMDPAQKLSRKFENIGRDLWPSGQIAIEFCHARYPLQWAWANRYEPGWRRHVANLIWKPLNKSKKSGKHKK
jgi:hypothetical protein